MSMRTETLSLVISGDGRLLGTELGKAEKQIKTFAGKAGGMFTGFGKGIMGAVGKLANPLALIGGGAGILLAGRNLIDYQDSLSSLGISAGLNAKKMMELDKRIHDLAYTTGQSREGLVDALKTMASDVDTEFAVEAISHVGEAATAMSFDINEAAQVFTVFRRDLKATSQEAAGLFDMMMSMNQGTAGLSKIAAAVSSLGLTKDNFAQYNALIQTTKNLFGGEEAAAGAIEQIAMRTLGKQGRALRRRVGEDLFGDDGRIKDFRAFMERTSKVLNERQLQSVFGVKNSRAFLRFQSAEAIQEFDDYIAKGQVAGRVIDAFAWKQKEAKYQLNALSSAAKEFAGVALSPVLSDLTAQLNALTNNPDAMENFRGSLQDIATVMGVLGSAAGGAARWLREWRAEWDAIANNIFKERLDKIPDKERAALAKKHNMISYPDSDTRHNAILDDYYTTFAYRDKEQRGSALNKLQEENAKKIAERGGGWGHLRSELSDMWATMLGKQHPPEVKNNIIINQEITPDGRVITQTNDPNTSLTTNLNRGLF